MSSGITTPPKPAPASWIPYASPLRWTNHSSKKFRVTVLTRLPPMPYMIPCVMMSCQTCVAKDEATRAATTSKVPISNPVRRAPGQRLKTLKTNGELKYMIPCASWLYENVFSHKKAVLRALRTVHVVPTAEIPDGCVENGSCVE